MKVSVKVSGSGQGFGGAITTTPSTKVTIDAADFETGQATLAALSVLHSLGVGEAIDFEDPDVGTTEQSDSEDSPEDGYFDGDTLPDVPAYGWKGADGKGDPTQRVSNPGDAVLLIWGDNTFRAFIDSGTQWVAPAVAGRFEEPMSVEFTDSKVTAVVVGKQSDPGVPYGPEASEQE